jgi:hypothetical protein
MHSSIQQDSVILDVYQPGTCANVGIRIEVRNLHDENEANLAGNLISTTQMALVS